MKTVFVWLFMAVINPSVPVPEDRVPLYVETQAYFTDELCQEALNEAEKLRNDRQMREIIVNKCYEVSYPTAPEMQVRK